MSTSFIFNNYSSRKSNVKSNSFIIPIFTSINSRNLPKYRYDKYFFNKNYMKKTIFLENQINREQLLTSKKNEKIFNELFD